jgi:hypothetical protein
VFAVPHSMGRAQAIATANQALLEPSATTAPRIAESLGPVLIPREHLGADGVRLLECRSGSRADILKMEVAAGCQGMKPQTIILLTMVGATLLTKSARIAGSPRSALATRSFIASF